MYGTSSFNIKKSFLPLPSLTKRLYRFYHFDRSPKKYFAILEVRLRQILGPLSKYKKKDITSLQPFFLTFGNVAL
jgi:hypothetical protein